MAQINGADRKKSSQSVARAPLEAWCRTALLDLHQKVSRLSDNQVFDMYRILCSITTDLNTEKCAEHSIKPALSPSPAAPPAPARPPDSTRGWSPFEPTPLFSAGNPFFLPAPASDLDSELSVNSPNSPSDVRPAAEYDQVSPLQSYVPQNMQPACAPRSLRPDAPEFVLLPSAAPASTRHHKGQRRFPVMHKISSLNDIKTSLDDIKALKNAWDTAPHTYGSPNAQVAPQFTLVMRRAFPVDPEFLNPTTTQWCRHELACVRPDCIRLHAESFPPQEAFFNKCRQEQHPDAGRLGQVRPYTSLCSQSLGR